LVQLSKVVKNANEEVKTTALEVKRPLESRIKSLETRVEVSVKIVKEKEIIIQELSQIIEDMTNELETQRKEKLNLTKERDNVKSEKEELNWIIKSQAAEIRKELGSKIKALEGKLKDKSVLLSKKEADVKVALILKHKYLDDLNQSIVKNEILARDILILKEKKRGYEEQIDILNRRIKNSRTISEEMAIIKKPLVRKINQLEEKVRIAEGVVEEKEVIIRSLQKEKTKSKYYREKMNDGRNRLKSVKDEIKKSLEIISAE